MTPTPTGPGAPTPDGPTPDGPTPDDPTPGDPTPDDDGRDAAGLRPDALLAGPRGRRLCLELADMAATAASNNPHRSEFGMARFHAAYALDPDRGQSVVLFGPGADAEPPTPSPGEVAALLEAVPLPTLAETALLTALTATVNAARYWQKPDGDDVLAASAEMRGALHRFARLLADSPHTQWWTAPLDPAGQWAVSFVDDPPRPPVQSRGAAETLKQWRLDVLEEERRAATDRPSDPAANFSGTWWSRPPSGLVSSTRTMADRGPVGLWLVEDRFSEEEATTEQLSVPAGARIFEIDSPGAWAQLCREHPLEVTASKQHDWYRTTGRTGPWVMPDWSCFRDKYDAVHLTMGGYLATAGVAIPVDDGCASVLAGWDPDATFWLSDASPDTSTHQGWLLDQEGPAWMLQGSRPRSLTTPARSDWSLTHNGYRVSHEAALLGTGDALWQRVCADVLCWKVKTRSGFTVNAPGPVSAGDRVNVTAALFGVKVVEPVEVVAVVDTPDRVGFSYRTLPGHPVSGEEAFIVHRVGDEVHVSIRSLTRAAPQQPWHALFPLLMLVQRLVRRRYLRALR
ncbi:DUF1990 domain-containing protein [Arthrobacter sp. H35-D1]|uniref:DUF1990 domain-containing protein n=1 Tax=Arthrobacter sp. H35-D1 TaxID=3046202 RepID=UPI0024B8DA6B|nr:DUF1990 domain-containing protein [Arthrobacter sp. H35-D1]MDJ0313455.1 DUF1990 domain-containing protein [Arthrobacter sp. H35-D1]